MKSTWGRMKKIKLYNFCIAINLNSLHKLHILNNMNFALLQGDFSSKMEYTRRVGGKKKALSTLYCTSGACTVLWKIKNRNSSVQFIIQEENHASHCAN